MVAIRIATFSSLLAFASVVAGYTPYIISPTGSTAWAVGTQETVRWTTGMALVDIDYICGESVLQIFGQGKSEDVAHGFSMLRGWVDIRVPDLPYGLYQFRVTCGTFTGQSQPFHITDAE